VGNTISFPDELPEQQRALRARLLHPMGTLVEFAKDEVEKSIPERFEKIVRTYPCRIAVKTDDRVVTYSELNAMANRVAHAILAERGNKPEPVGLLVEKGPALFASMLGVLKAGKFFALIDPSFPQARIAAILQDTGAELLMTDQNNARLAREAESGGGRVMEFESIDCAAFAEDPPLQNSPDTLAYVIYTSGSTGKPKGVIQTHRNLLHNIRLRAKTTPVYLDDRIAQLPSGTSNAITNTFFALLNGPELLPFDVQSNGVTRLATWLLQQKISFLWISSPLFRTLCESLTGNEGFPDLRLLRLMSETAYKADVELYKKYFSTKCLLVNALHSTETGPIRSYFIDHRTEVSGNEVPVGYAVEDKEILLLDDEGKQVGFNQCGEIVVRSNYLSPGYWNRPDLTEAKFRPDLDDREKRLYFTGDLGLMHPDGCLTHQGRKDFRVKIRGYGVDLLEVERNLREHAAIQDTAVVARKNDIGGSRLIGYFTSHVQPPPSVSELRGFLINKLPDYMVPLVFVRLDSIPLTPSGKVDRQALPDPDDSRPDLNVSFVAPRTAIEEKLVQIWEEVLDVRPIGIHDDFFDLGGHSLLASRLLVQIDKVFGKQLPLVTLVHARTIEKLAAVLRQDGWTPPHSLLVPIQPSGSNPPLFWASGDSSDFLLPRYLGQDQPLYALMHQCHDGKPVRYPRLEDLAANHLQEIRRVQPQGPYFLGGYCFEGMVAFEMAQQLRQQGQEVALLALLDLASIKNCKFIVNQVPSSHESLGDEAFRHLHELAKLNSQDKLRYTLVRVKDRMNELIDGIKNIRVLVARSISRIYLMLGRPVPLSLLLPYISLVDRKILRVYEPRPYPGRLVHFRAETGSADAALVARLCSGNLEEVEISGNHFQLGKQPHLQVWATTLKTYLEQAQADELTKQPETCSATAQL